MMDFKLIETQLKNSGTGVSVAEAQGIAAGMLCIDSAGTAGDWLSEVLADGKPTEETIAVLTGLFEFTRAGLMNEDYCFELLLPDDEDNLSDRAEALCEWCQGFLFGIGYGRSDARESDDERPKMTDWPGETGEILKDIVEFTKMDLNREAPLSEEEAAAFVEIYEYLKVVVFLIRNEFASSSEVCDLD